MTAFPPVPQFPEEPPAPREISKNVQKPDSAEDRSLDSLLARSKSLVLRQPDCNVSAGQKGRPGRLLTPPSGPAFPPRSGGFGTAGDGSPFAPTKNGIWYPVAISKMAQPASSAPKPPAYDNSCELPAPLPAESCSISQCSSPVRQERSCALLRLNC